MKDLSLDSRQHLDSIVTQFEETWKPPTSNQIEQVLLQHSEVDRSALLSELLLVEFELVSNSTGMPHNIADYVRRFSDDALLVLDAWDKFCGSGSQRDSTPQANLSTPVGGMAATVMSSLGIPDDPEATLFDGGGRRPKNDTDHVIGRYQILRRIGRGGMGIVYRAFDPQTKREVALKVIQSGLLASSEEKRRFQREAEAVSQLNHPNIVPVYDCQLNDDQSFFAMQLIEGKTLKERIGQGILPAEDAAALLSDLAGAMQHAHERNIVHRDLKPGNILLEANSNHPWVLDFGLAFYMTNQDQLTRTGAVLGTPQFMSPEQAIGAAGSSEAIETLVLPTSSRALESAARSYQIDGRTDVYGLGALLYYVLTGTAPYNAATTLQVLDKVANEEPPSLSGNSDVPQDLATICHKCLQKDPADRYSTARELSEDLNRFLQQKPILARRTSLPRRVRQWALRNPWPTRFIATLLITAVCAGVAAFAFQGIAISESDARLQAEDNRRRAEDARLREQEAKQKAEKANVNLKDAIARFQDENRGRIMAQAQGALAVRDYDSFHRTTQAFEQLNGDRNPSQASLMRTALEAHNHPRLLETKRLQAGHWDVSSADVSLDGKRLVTLDGASVISVFDLQRHRPLHRLTNGFLLTKPYEIRGNVFPTGYAPHYSDLAATPKMIVGQQAEYTSVAWIGDPEKVLVTAQDGQCLLLNAEQPVDDQVQPERLLWTSPQPLTTSAASLAGDSVLVGDCTGRVTLLSLDAEPVMATANVDSAVTCIRSCESGWLIGSEDGRLTVLSTDLHKVASAETGAAIWSLAVRENLIAVGNDSPVVSVYEQGESLKLKHQRSFDQPVELGDRVEAFVSLQFFKDELWAFDHDGRVYVWDSTGQGERIGTACPGIRRRNAIIERCPRYRRVVFAEPVAAEMLIADQAGMVRFLQVERPELRPGFDELPTRLSANPRIAYAVDGQHVLWAIDDSGTLSAIDWQGRLLDSTQVFPAIKRDAALQGTVRGLYPGGTDLAVMSDGSVLTVGLDQTVGRWKLEDGRIVQQSERYSSQHPLMSVAVSEEQMLLASVDVKSNVNVWDLQTGRRIRMFPVNKDDDDPSPPLTGRLAFNCDGTRLAAFGTGQSSRVFDTNSWLPLKISLETAGDGSVDVVWSSLIPDLLVRSDTRATVQVYEKRHSSRGVRPNPGTRLFSNTDLLLTADRSGNLTLRSVLTGAGLFAFKATEGPVCDLTASEHAGLFLCRTDGTLLKQFIPDNQMVDIAVTDLNPDVLEIVPESAGYQSLASYAMSLDDKSRLSFPIKASVGNAYGTGDALLVKRVSDRWTFEVVFSDEQRPVFSGPIAWLPQSGLMAFRVVTDTANYCGDLILLRKTERGWREELIDGNSNTGLTPILHSSERGLSVLHHDANFRDIVQHTVDDAGPDGWPMIRMVRKSGSGLCGRFHKGKTWVMTQSYSTQAANVPQIFVWDGHELEPRPVPADMKYYGDLRFTKSDDPAVLCHTRSGAGNEIRVLRNDEWQILVEIPKPAGLSHIPYHWTFAPNDTIVVPLVLFSKIAVMIHRQGQWSQISLNCDLGDRRLGVRAIEIDEVGFTTITVAPGEGNPNWLKAIEFQLP